LLSWTKYQYQAISAKVVTQIRNVFKRYKKHNAVVPTTEKRYQCLLQIIMSPLVEDVWYTPTGGLNDQTRAHGKDGHIWKNKQFYSELNILPNAHSPSPLPVFHLLPRRPNIYLLWRKAPYSTWQRH
jgi:hypothetical protein